MLINAELIGAFGDGDRAMIMYDTRTPIVESAPGAECVTLSNGKIVTNRFLFDRLPFEDDRSRPLSGLS